MTTYDPHAIPHDAPHEPDWWALLVAMAGNAALWALILWGAARVAAWMEGR